MSPLHDRCSSAVVRVVSRVVTACRGQNVADDVVPLLLLAALWRDESRAAHQLAQAGVTLAICDELLPAGAPVLTDARGEHPASASPWPAVITAILQEAHSEAAVLGRVEEIQTEHLLHALLRTTPRLADRLAARGVDLSSLEQDRSRRQTQEPIAADLQIVFQQSPVNERQQVDRVLDASANRAREGLRVVEDYVRFLLDDALLTAHFKGVRHELTHWLKRIGVEEALPLRDTPHDVGTSITTVQEASRESPRNVARANIKRVQEALRTLAEFGKLRDSEAARGLEQLRYQTYTLEQTLHAVDGARQRFESAQLYLLVTDQLCPHGFGPVVRGAIAGGVDVVQLREKTMPDRRLLDTARYIREWTAAAGVLFIINDRPDLAVLCGADGVHLGQDDLPPAAARRIIGGRSLLGISTHNIAQARQAVLDGADYLGVGPCFPSSTKSFTEFPGVDLVKAMVGETALPWFPLGGISRETLPAVQAAGARRAAVSAAICQAASPEDATRELKSMLTAAPA